MTFATVVKFQLLSKPVHFGFFFVKVNLTQSRSRFEHVVGVTFKLSGQCFSPRAAGSGPPPVYGLVIQPSCWRSLFASVETAKAKPWQGPSAWNMSDCDKVRSLSRGLASLLDPGALVSPNAWHKFSKHLNCASVVHAD